MNTTLIPRLHVGSGSTVGALTLFPVWTESPSVDGYLWTGESLTVAEHQEAPVVEELMVRNKSGGSAVILEGDLLEGGWQNRMAAGSWLLGAGDSTVLSVRCVEQRRWAGGAGHTATGRKSSYAVRFHGRDGLAESADQRAVWSTIERLEQQFGPTVSSSVNDHLARHQAPSFPLLEGQRGVIIGVGGQVIAAELFGSSAGLAGRWEGIVAAAWLDAQSAPVIPTPAEAARQFVRRIDSTRLQDRGAAGVGRRVGAARRSLTLTGLAADRGAGPELVQLTAVNPVHPMLVSA